MDNRPYPKSGRRGCQCKDGTYRIDCCDGDSQGVGSLLNQSVSIYNYEDGDTGTTVTVHGAVTLECNNINLIGFSVDEEGVITLPTVNIGTIASTSPSSFDAVTEDTSRTLTVTINVPSGYTNSGSTIVCTTTATQSAPTLSCSDITISGFAVAYDGVITLPTVDVGTIASTSPASFDDPDVDTLRTLTVNITVPAGYTNTGSTLACTTTATQPGTQPTLACSDITFSGLSVGIGGDVSTPTVNIGTVSSVSPTSFNGHVTTDTSRSVTVNITVPSGYSNSGQTLACSQTVTQTAVKEFWGLSGSILTPSQPNRLYPAPQSTVCTQWPIGPNSSVLAFVHDGSGDFPTRDDDVRIVQSNVGGGAYYPIRRTDSNGNVTIGELLHAIGGTNYHPVINTDPSTLQSQVYADAYITTNSVDGFTGSVVCP